jgi:predicted Zn-ribbon and HTH transcriptional regulator
MFAAICRECGYESSEHSNKDTLRKELKHDNVNMENLTCPHCKTRLSIVRPGRLE